MMSVDFYIGWAVGFIGTLIGLWFVKQREIRKLNQRGTGK